MSRSSDRARSSARRRSRSTVCRPCRRSVPSGCRRVPEPSQASALASAGIERTPSTSAAMSLSATAVIHAAPNAISIVTSAAVATAQEALVSIEDDDCSIRRDPAGILLQAAQHLTTHGREGLPCLLRCAKMRGKGAGGNFLLEHARINEIDPKPQRCSLYAGFAALRRKRQAYMSGIPVPCAPR